MNIILIVYHSEIESFKKQFIEKISNNLIKINYEVINTNSLIEAYEITKQNPRITAILFDWDNFGVRNLHHFTNGNQFLPIFIMTNRHADIDLNLVDLNLNLDFLKYDSNLISDDIDRILLAIKQYNQAVLPPFTKKLMNYVNELNYAFCTPGHLGGTAFQKTPSGAQFYDFLGPNIFKADSSVSIEELGSLLDHSGPHKDAEKFIADTFGSDRSFIVTNGTSTANKMVGMFAATAGDTVVVDRNCHKSIAQLLMMIDVNPIYLKPTRNAYGILGGIPESEYSQQSIQEKIDQHPDAKKWPVYGVITNSTYDGIFYKVENIQKNLKVKNLHFDSAWVPYTHFHPIYNGLYGLSLQPEKDQVIFETQSTHKLLAAFSQVSMIHTKGNFNETSFNEVYMMHTSTSPFYPMVASCETSAAMMCFNQGFYLMEDSINYAMDFRTEILRLKKQSKDWFFDVWQGKNEKKLSCFPLHPNDTWHGFKTVDKDHLFLDPIKVTILCPGITHDELDEWGIPAVIVEKFLASHGIIVEKTGPYSMLFLFSIGITKAKSMKLLEALNQFKKFFDKNAPVKIVLPHLYEKHPEFYENMKIQSVADKIHSLMKKHTFTKSMYHAFDTLPEITMTPHHAFQHLVNKNVEYIPLEQLKNRTSAVMILPYPPGVPLIMPGEKVTDASQAVLDFLLMLDEIGEALPGFETDIHGLITGDDGKLYAQVIKE